MGSERGGTETERKQNGPAQSRAPGPRTRDMRPETETETGMETNQNDKRMEKRKPNENGNTTERNIRETHSFYFKRFIFILSLFLCLFLCLFLIRFLSEKL